MREMTSDRFDLDQLEAAGEAAIAVKHPGLLDAVRSGKYGFKVYEEAGATDEEPSPFGEVYLTDDGEPFVLLCKISLHHLAVA